MAPVREAVSKQLGTERPLAVDADPEHLVRFSPELPRELPAGERQRLEREAERLAPWLQGPFLLGGDLVVGGAWRSDCRWVDFGDAVPQDLSGMRVLDVGSNAGYDAFMFALRGAGEVLACEPFEFIEQARFLESIYRSGVDFRQIRWQELDPGEHGQFDIVHCHGVLYHDLDPAGLVWRVRDMTAPGGTVLLGSIVLADPLLAEYARFVPGSYYGDPTWWWVPGRLTLRWLAETAGLDVDGFFGEAPGPPGEFETLRTYVRARRARQDPR
jgi:tRNA (mo5U34)-methyltransferase